MDLEELRAKLAAFYNPIGRPSFDPELLIRMLLVGYCFAIRSERRLCEEVHLNLAYHWLCRLVLGGDPLRRWKLPGSGGLSRTADLSKVPVESG